MLTKQKYIEYLISTPVNYTCSNLAAHLEQVSYAAVSDYLQRDKLTARGLWELVSSLLNGYSPSLLIGGRQCAGQTLLPKNRTGQTSV